MATGGRRRPPAWLEYLVAGLVTVALVLGTRACVTAADRANPPQLDEETVRRSRAPSRSVDAREEVTSAALDIATAPQKWLYLTDEEVEAAVRGVAAPNRANALVAAVLEDIRDAREGMSESSGPVWWIVRPLAVHVDDLFDDRATVDVWVVTVLSAREVAAPQAEWRTVGLDLVWTGGDWKVDAVRDTPGPTPMVGPGDRPWDAVPFDEALEGFERLDGEVVR